MRLPNFAWLTIPGGSHIVRGEMSSRNLRVWPTYTAKQGQYLAFIYYYTKINRQAPAEADMQRYFQVTPPTVHQMVLLLEQLGFIARVPGQARSIQVLLPPDQLPPLA